MVRVNRKFWANMFLEEAGSYTMEYDNADAALLALLDEDLGLYVGTVIRDDKGTRIENWIGGASEAKQHAKEWQEHIRSYQ